MNSAYPTDPASPTPAHRVRSGPAAARTQPATAARPVMGVPADGRSLSCDGCGQAPADPLQQILMSAVWLVPGPDASDSPVTACYCRACPPDGPITDLTCLRCGDGPLLVGDLAADADDVLPAASRDWLTAAGWRLDGPVCPGCRPRH